MTSKTCHFALVSHICTYMSICLCSSIICIVAPLFIFRVWTDRQTSHLWVCTCLCSSTYCLIARIISNFSAVYICCIRVIFTCHMSLQFFCYFLLSYAILCNFLLFSAIFCYFMLFSDILCYFLLFSSNG